MTANEDLLGEFEAVASEAQAMSFMPRASELQEAAILRIDRFLQTLELRKTEHIRLTNDKGANFVLSMQFGLRAIRAELGMWLKLKRDDGEGAWNELISAQQTLGAALLVRRQLGFESTGIENLIKRLSFIEQWVFPPQIFNSIGGRAKRRECSICGVEYDECEHVIGRAYMGNMCHTIIREFDLAEVSIVDSPADKRCRITHFSDQGKYRNKMTWRLEESHETERARASAQQLLSESRPDAGA